MRPIPRLVRGFRPQLFSVPCRQRATSSVDSVQVQTDYDRAKPFSEIPGPKGLPYIGTMLQYRNGPFKRYSIERFQDALLERRKKYGKLFQETIAGVTVVHLFDPDDVRQVFMTEGKMPHIAPLMNTTKMFREQKGMALGLGNTNGEEWYRLRSAVQQMMMRPKAVTVYLPFVDEVASEFIQRLKNIRDKNNEVPDLRNEISKWNVESAAVTVFEKRLHCLEGGPDSPTRKVIDANHAMFSLSAQLKFSLPWHNVFRTTPWKKLVEAENCVLSMSEQLLRETLGTIDSLLTSGQLKDGQYNFLMYLLSRKELTQHDVSVITLSLFGDGLSTTSPTLASHLYCLARHPEVQEKVYQEVQEFVPREGPITAEIINRLSYLKAFVKEAFRFFPIGLNVERIPQQNLVIGGYQIPAGTHVELNNFAMFVDPQYFTDPEKFMPERWLRDGSAQNIHPFILTPFGHGPRMCAGRRFAEQEMYVVMAKILQNFRLEWHYPDLKQTFQMLMIPDSPVRVTFLDRN